MMDEPTIEVPMSLFDALLNTVAELPYRDAAPLFHALAPVIAEFQEKSDEPRIQLN